MLENYILFFSVVLRRSFPLLSGNVIPGLKKIGMSKFLIHHSWHITTSPLSRSWGIFISSQLLSHSWGSSNVPFVIPEELLFPIFFLTGYSPVPVLCYSSLLSTLILWQVDFCLKIWRSHWIKSSWSTSEFWKIIFDVTEYEKFQFRFVAESREEETKTVLASRKINHAHFRSASLFR